MKTAIPAPIIKGAKIFKIVLKAPNNVSKLFKVKCKIIAPKTNIAIERKLFLFSSIIFSY